MPGISGTIAARDRPLSQPAALLEAFDRVQALQGIRFVTRQLVTPCCVIQNAMTGILRRSLDQPATDPTRNVHLFLEGEVFNLEELAPGLKAPPASPAPCEILLALYLEQGTAFAARLDGHFNIVIHEEREGRLTVFADRIASKPFYYSEENGALCFGSEKKAILAASTGTPRLDPLGLLQVFAYRHNLSGRTFIEGIRRLPASSSLRFEDGRVTVSRYELMRFGVPSNLPPVRSLVEGWGAALQDDMRRRVRGKERILISLSGGLDSRAFTCAIPRDYRPLWARTRGAAECLDVLYATEIARRLGIQHLHEDPEDVPYSQIVSKAVWRTEGEVSFTHCLTVAAHETIKRHGDCLFAGQSGEIVAGGHIYPYMLVPRSRQSFVERAYEWYLIYPEHKLQGLFQRDFLRHMFPQLKAAFIASFDGLEADHNADLYAIWNLYERQSRMTLSAGPVDSHLFEKVYALIGRSYTDFALTLPVRLRFGQTLYQAMIHDLGPEIRDVPYANTDLPLRRTVAGNLFNKAHHLARKAWDKSLRKVGLAGPPRQVADRENLGESLRRDPMFRQLIEGFVSSDACDPAVFDREGIRSMLAAHYAGARDASSLLCLLATFAVAVPYFVAHRTTSCPPEAEPVPEGLRQGAAATAL